MMMDDSKKILIIDDDSKNIFALSAVLRSKQFPCVSAESAMQGFSILEHEKNIGLVLMDMMMPDMDGYEAIRKMKENKKLQNLPVIAVTAQAMTGDKERCIAAGASGYISKPINVDELLTLINKLT
jgi:two-component system cell cycle response regulator DivK